MRTVSVAPARLPGDANTTAMRSPFCTSPHCRAARTASRIASSSFAGARVIDTGRTLASVFQAIVNFTVQQVANIVNALIAMGHTLVTVFAQLAQTTFNVLSKFVQAMVQLEKLLSDRMDKGAAQPTA